MIFKIGGDVAAAQSPVRVAIVFMGANFGLQRFGESIVPCPMLAQDRLPIEMRKMLQEVAPLAGDDGILRAGGQDAVVTLEGLIQVCAVSHRLGHFAQFGDHIGAKFQGQGELGDRLIERDLRGASIIARFLWARARLG